ncbi:aspartate aminotransferase family protein [Lacrimispora sp.]|uniref:aspartate aminotransferase family protein n=1 Tax=Lacrimispora sp. TaxID=2719234 RepID=UPI0028A064B2|nr:aspartate aminotransferase family protein [Lacrimispora sp.]
MQKKPYELLRESVDNCTTVTPKNKEALYDFLEHEHPGCCLFTKWDNPPIIERGKGSRIWDVDGKEYIDCITGMSSMNIGHGDERVADVMSEQYKKLSHWFDFPTPERLKLVNKLIEITPGKFEKKVLLGLSGADSIDQAIRAARYHTKRPFIISFYGGYHGANMGTLALTGKGGMHRWHNPVPAHDTCIHHFPYPYCYRCTYGKEYGTCEMQCVKAIDMLLSSCETAMANPLSNVNNLAAVIVEPYQSSSGYIMPPKEFLVELRKLADKHGFLLIFDEIQTGMGRTGKMWACEHSEVVPDIMVLGKALGGGVPMSALVARSEIFDDFAPGAASNTYAGYALGCAVANKVLEIYEIDRLVENCAKTGEYLAKVVKEYSEKHPIVGTYSQQGVYLGIEYVMDRETKEPAVAATHDICNLMRESGLLAQLNGYYGNRISFLPPITLTPLEVDEIFAIMDKVTSEVEKKYNLV